MLRLYSCGNSTLAMITIVNGLSTSSKTCRLASNVKIDLFRPWHAWMLFPYINQGFEKWKKDEDKKMDLKLEKAKEEEQNQPIPQFKSTTTKCCWNEQISMKTYNVIRWNSLATLKGLPILEWVIEFTLV